MIEIFRVLQHFLMHLPRIIVIRASHTQLLHFLKLLHSEDSKRVPSMWTSFLPKACWVTSRSISPENKTFTMHLPTSKQSRKRMAMRESNTEGKYNQSPATTPERQINLYNKWEPRCKTMTGKTTSNTVSWSRTWIYVSFCSCSRCVLRFSRTALYILCQMKWALWICTWWARSFGSIQLFRCRAHEGCSTERMVCYFKNATDCIEKARNDV